MKIVPRSVMFVYCVGTFSVGCIAGWLMLLCFPSLFVFQRGGLFVLCDSVPAHGVLFGGLFVYLPFLVLSSFSTADRPRATPSG